MRITVDSEDMRAWSEEIFNLKRQVRELQIRGTELVEENRRLRRLSGGNYYCHSGGGSGGSTVVGTRSSKMRINIYRHEVRAMTKRYDVIVDGPYYGVRLYTGLADSEAVTLWVPERPSGAPKTKALRQIADLLMGAAEEIEGLEDSHNAVG